MDSIDKFLERVIAVFPLMPADSISVYQYAGRQGIGHNIKIWDKKYDCFIKVLKCSSEDEAIKQIILAVREFDPKNKKVAVKKDGLLENRNHFEDFAFLETVFQGKELRWSALEAAIYPGFASSQKGGRKLIGYWVRNWLVIKKGIDRSPDARYILGEKPQNP